MSNSAMVTARPITRPPPPIPASDQVGADGPSDFLSFRMSPLQGTAAHNKGMALFPRKIAGKFAMIARQDNAVLFDLLGQPVPMGRRSAILEAAIPLGGRADRQLRFTHRTRRGMAVAHARRRPGSKILNRRGTARQERSFQSTGAFGYRCCVPSRRNAKATFRTWSIPAARCGITDQIVLPYAVSDTYSNFATIDTAALMKAMWSCGGRRFSRAAPLEDR